MKITKLSLKKISTTIHKNPIQKKIVMHSDKTFRLENNKEIDLKPFLYGKKDNSDKEFNDSIKNKYDVIIVGAGHNGLICANYLARAGKKVLILEKRHQVGGCAVTEELVEGYKFSRCSYVLSLFRKKVIDELFPVEFYKKIKLFKRNPKGITPTEEVGKYLVRRSERELLKKEIAKFSEKDANRIDDLDNFLNRMVKIVDPLIDLTPPEKFSIFDKKFRKFIYHILKNSKDLYEFYHFLTSSAEYYLDKYLESDILKGTLATDAVIGAMKSPRSTGSAYVLLHHVMGSLDEEGSWFYVEGGNGAISEFLADQAIQNGVTIALNYPVQKFIIDKNKKSVEGVLAGTENINTHELKAKYVIVNCDLNSTYFKFMQKDERESLLSEELIKSFGSIDYASPVMKINLAVDQIPRLKCLENLLPEYNNDHEKLAKDFLTGTIHFNSDSVDAIDRAYIDALSGKPSTRPIIEMTIPSILDNTLTPANSGHHVIGLFCQYAPNKLSSGEWDNQIKKDFVKKIYNEIEKYSPGFTKSILYEDVLSPADLESEFSIRGGNIFHGSMDLNSIFFCRPFLGVSSYKQPVANLYSCSAAMHPGGGVMGAAGRNCANLIKEQEKH